MKTIMKLLLAALFMIAGQQAAAQRTTIAGALSRSERFSTLYAAAVRAGLGETLSNPDLAVTVLAPDNEAFERFAAKLNVSLDDIPAEDLARVLTYHVIPAAKNVNYLKRRTTWPTLLEGHSLNITKSRYFTYVVDEEGSIRRLSPVNQRLGKSYLHVVSDVLVPAADDENEEDDDTTPPAEAVPGPFASIAEAANSVPQLSTLFAAVGASSLLPAAQDGTTVATVFAPVNEAFPAALEYYSATVEQLVANTAQLDSLLNNHVVLGGAVTSTEIEDAQTFTTAAATTLTASLRDGSVYIKGPINEVKVITANVVAGAAIVHVVDGVLLI